MSERQETVGNAAAMREALEFVKRYLRLALQVCGDTKYFAGCMNVAANRCSDALAAPPRNCDRFADELDAQLAFLNEVWLISIDRETMTEQDAYENWTDEMRARYGRWLLAPATEQKGETDGSK